MVVVVIVAALEWKAVGLVARVLLSRLLLLLLLVHLLPWPSRDVVERVWPRCGWWAHWRMMEGMNRSTGVLLFVAMILPAGSTIRHSDPLAVLAHLHPVRCLFFLPTLLRQLSIW